MEETKTDSKIINLPTLSRKQRRERTNKRNLRVQTITLIDGTIKKIFHQKQTNLPRLYNGMSKIK